MDQIELTERQEAVARSLLRRLPYKTIAAELGIAESTVNDHIQALKRKFEVNSTQQLVEALLAADLLVDRTPEIGGHRIKRVEASAFFDESPWQDDELVLADVTGGFPETAELIWPSEPKVVPEELDGPNAIVPRLLDIGKTLVLLLVALVLTVAAINGVNSLVLDNRTASESD